MKIRNKLINKWMLLTLVQVVMLSGVVSVPATVVAKEVQAKREYKLLGNDVFPEGIAYDETTDTVFVGSFRRGEIQTIKNNEVSVFMPEGKHDTHSIVGLKVDNQRRRLWVCNSEAGASKHVYNGAVGRSSIQVYDIDKQTLLAGDQEYFVEKDAFT